MQRRSRPGPPPASVGAAWLTTASLVLALPPTASQGQPRSEDDFGRWERGSQRCELILPPPLPAAQPSAAAPHAAAGAVPQAGTATSQGQRQNCSGLRLDQQLAGLLSVRFLAGSGGRSGPAQQLLFAGVLLPGSQPLRCHDGLCTPIWPLQLQVSSMASSSTNALRLPQAQLATGSCRLEKHQASCEARDGDGRLWQASAQW